MFKFLSSRLHRRLGTPARNPACSTTLTRLLGSDKVGSYSTYAISVAGLTYTYTTPGVLARARSIMSTPPPPQLKSYTGNVIRWFFIAAFPFACLTTEHYDVIYS